MTSNKNRSTVEFRRLQFEFRTYDIVYAITEQWRNRRDFFLARRLSNPPGPPSYCYGGGSRTFRRRNFKLVRPSIIRRAPRRRIVCINKVGRKKKGKKIEKYNKILLIITVVPVPGHNENIYDGSWPEAGGGDDDDRVAAASDPFT